MTFFKKKLKDPFKDTFKDTLMIIFVKKVINIYVNTTNNDHVINNCNYKYTSNDG